MDVVVKENYYRVNGVDFCFRCLGDAKKYIKQIMTRDERLRLLRDSCIERVINGVVFSTTKIKLNSRGECGFCKTIKK